MLNNELIPILIVGLGTGLLASLFMAGRLLGLAGDLVMGVLGALLGGWLLNQLGFSFYGFWGYNMASFVTALTLLYLSRLFSR